MCILITITIISFGYGCGIGKEPSSGNSSDIKSETKPIITEINHYVLTPADEYYISDSRMEGYKKAIDAIFSHEESVRLTDSYDDNLSILGYIQKSPYAFILSEYDITSDHGGMYFKYGYSKEECDEIIDFIDDEYLALINENITKDMTELEKVLAIYKYFAKRISYDYEWLDEMNMSEDKFLFPDVTVYQALKTNKGVCHTYTYLCQFAFQQLDIACERATADMVDSDGGHMWPIVWIDEVAFHIDPTWDAEGEGTSLKYFGMTDEENIQRGMVNNWGVSIDMALDIECSDTRFANWRDITDYELIGDNKMKAYREDGSTDIINLK